MEKTFASTYETIFIASLKSHSRKAFNELYDRYAPILFGIITRIIISDEEAKDVLQDTFVKVWKGIHHYDPAKGRLFAWMRNIARTTALDHLRAKKNAQKVVYQVGKDAVTYTRIDPIGFRGIVSMALNANYGQMIELIGVATKQWTKV